MSATEYDVLVNLKVSRENQRAMSGSTRGFRQAIAQAERDQQRMHKAEASRQRQQERQAVRGVAQVERDRQKSYRAAVMRSRSMERDKIRADGISRRLERMRLVEDAKGAAARKRWVNDIAKTGSKMGGAGNSALGGAGNLFSGVGTGGAAAWATRAGTVITGILAGAVAAGLAKGASGGFQDQVNSESFIGSAATTMQLYGFNKHVGGPQEQFNENLENAKYYQQELTRIADQSPGDIGQVTDLFEGVLPGIAGITQDSGKITDITQKLTLLGGTLKDFQMVGSQSGQILQGGAGSEFKTWLRVAEPIRKAGIEMKLFKKEQKGGAKLTEAFNKLDATDRLKLFEAGLKSLGPEVAAYYENTFDGISSQAKSTLLSLRKELGKGMFDAAKARLKALTGEGGALDRKGKTFENAQAFASYLGQQMGKAITGSLNIAEKVFSYVANNWQTIVMRAQQAGHYLVTGAKLAASLMAVRTGVGAAAGLGGGALSAFTGIASAASSILSMGLAAAVVAPLLIGMGIVFAGAGVLVGGVVAYVVSNLDTLAEKFWTWSSSAGDVIGPFFAAVDTLAAQFVALGGYLVGAGTDTDMFTTVTQTATWAVEAAGGAFWGLIDITADVIVAFASIIDEVTRHARNLGLISGVTHADITTAKDAYNAYIPEQGIFESDSAFEKRLDETINSAGAKTALAELERVEGQYRSQGLSGGAQKVAAKLHGAADAARAGKADPTEWGMTDFLFSKLNPIGPPKPPPGGDKTPPKINFKQVNHNTWHVRDTDPNAIVAGFNKTNARKAAQPLRSALAMTRRI